MLQSLICLEDGDIETVLDAVTAFCVGEGVQVESDRGQKALSAAIDLVNNRRAADVLSEIRAKLVSTH